MVIPILGDGCHERVCVVFDMRVDADRKSHHSRSDEKGNGEIVKETMKEKIAASRPGEQESVIRRKVWNQFAPKFIAASPEYDQILQSWLTSFEPYTDGMTT
jgi:hypothetical protein